MREMKSAEMLRLLKTLFIGNGLLRRAPRWSVEQLRAWQFLRIQELVTDAYHHVPFYGELYQSVGFAPGDLQQWSDFEQLPVITKEQVIENYPGKILRRDLRPEGLIVSRSSGSTGKVLDIAYDGQAFITYIMAGLRLYRMGFNYLPWHRQTYIYTSPYPLNSLFGLYPLDYISTIAPMSETVQRLRAQRPSLLVCYPSHLKQIAQALTSEERLRLGIKAISVNSEMSTQGERDELARNFGCPVLDEYSSEELTRIAAQCRHKSYHLFEDINYLEALDEAGRSTSGLGVLVGTNLHNRAMPMIRYQQNDLGTLAPSSCDCAWTFRVLKNLQGRKNDSFVMPSGRILTSGFLLDATYDILLGDRTAIRDFCLIQTKLAEVLLEIVPGTGWNDGVAAGIRDKFKVFLEAGVVFSIRVVEECTKTKTGKRNPIINLASRGGQP